MANVLSLVERGWRGARECSLILSARGISVTHLIKGSLSPDVRVMIQTVPHTRIIDVPRLWFRVATWGHVLFVGGRGMTRWVLVDHERTLRELSGWCRLTGVTCILIQPSGNGYQFSVEQRGASLDEVFGRADGAGQSGATPTTSRLRSQSTCSAAGTGGRTTVHTCGH